MKHLPQPGSPFAHPLVAPVSWAMGQLAERSANARAQYFSDFPRSAMGLGAAQSLYRGYIQNRPPEGEPSGAGLVPLMARAGFEESPVSAEAAAAFNALSRSPAGTVGRFATSPQGVDFAASMAQALPENVMAGGAFRGLGAVGRATGAGTMARRALSPVLNELVPGAGIPDEAARELYRGSTTRAIGEQSLRNAETEARMARFDQIVAESATQRGITPDQASDLITTAWERSRPTMGASLATLSPVEQEAAQILRFEAEGQVAGRVARELKPNILGTPVPDPEQVAYVHRSITPQAAKQLRLREGPIAANTGLGTSAVPRRVSEPGLTTEQLNVELAPRNVLGLPSARFFKPTGTATREGAAYNNAITAHADILNEAARVRGKIVPEGRPAPVGWRSLADLTRGRGRTQVISGYDDAAKARLERTFLPPEEYRFLEQLTETMSPESYGRVRNVLRRIGSGFKQMALFSPRFISRNFQNNIGVGVLEGNHNPKNWSDGMALAVGTMDPARKLPQVGMTAGEYLKDAARRGVAGTGITALDIPKAGTSAVGKVFNRWRSTNQQVEDASRYSMDLFFRSKGMSGTESAKRVVNALGNYGETAFTPAMNALRRYGLPFAAWRVNILRTTARLFMEKPGSMSAFERGRRSIGEFAGTTPEEERTLGPQFEQTPGVVVPFTGKNAAPGDVLTTPLNLGPYDVNRDLDPTSIVQDAYPWWQLIASYATPTARGKVGYDYLRQKPLTGAPTILPSWFRSVALVAPDFWNKFGIHQDPESGQLIGDDRLNVMLRSLPVPVVNMMADVESGDPQARRRAVAFLTGLNQYVRNTQEGKRIQTSVRRRGVREQRKERRSESFFYRRLHRPQK